MKHAGDVGSIFIICPARLKFYTCIAVGNQALRDIWIIVDPGQPVHNHILIWIFSGHVIFSEVFFKLLILCRFESYGMDMQTDNHLHMWLNSLKSEIAEQLLAWKQSLAFVIVLSILIGFYIWRKIFPAGQSYLS